MTEPSYIAAALLIALLWIGSWWLTRPREEDNKGVNAIGDGAFAVGGNVGQIGDTIHLPGDDPATDIQFSATRPSAQFPVGSNVNGIIWKPGYS